MGRRLLLALGGNAILPAGGAGTIEEQREITLSTMRPLAAFLQPDDQLVLTHGNGPVVGNILLRNAAAAPSIPAMPLDICDADSQGGLGYMMAQCLENAFSERRIDRPVTALITRVEVDPLDSAFQNPTKPIGPFYGKDQAETFARERGWIVREDSGRGWRRVVPSPRPVRVIELAAIRTLLAAGQAVVAVGGGGVPVATGGGVEVGIEAVIDKDRASALLAAQLGFDTFVIVTAVTHVAIDFGKPTQRDVDRMTVAEARQWMDEGQFGVGSMLPKIESALQFIEAGGREVLITSPEVLGPALAGSNGTRIVP